MFKNNTQGDGLCSLRVIMQAKDKRYKAHKDYNHRSNRFREFIESIVVKRGVDGEKYEPVNTEIENIKIWMISADNREMLPRDLWFDIINYYQLEKLPTISVFAVLSSILATEVLQKYFVLVFSNAFPISKQDEAEPPYYTKSTYQNLKSIVNGEAIQYMNEHAFIIPNKIWDNPFIANLKHEYKLLVKKSENVYQ